MTYDELVDVWFAPLAEPIAVPPLPLTPARRLRDAIEPIATMGWWPREAAEALGALGLGFLESYVWGRAAALGTPAASVVVSTFGVFEPGFLSGVYNHSSSLASRDAVLVARDEGACAAMATVVSEDEASALADPLLDALDQLDGIGRPLFSGLRELPLPPTPQGRLWRAAELVREHRGDGHIAAGVAAGLDPVELNVLTELWIGYPIGEYTGTRGYGPDQIASTVARLTARGWISDGALTPEGRAARDQLEADTDVSQHDLITRLGDQLEGMIAACEEISDRILAVPAFPSDPRKRAGG
jgi:hypothetical protein